MSSVMKVSKPTFDALTTGNQNLSFNSELATHSIYNILTIIRPAGGDATVTINHALGYPPKTWLFLQDSDADGEFLSRLPRNTFISADSIDYYITDDDLVIEFENTSNEYIIKILVFTRSPNI